MQLSSRGPFRRQIGHCFLSQLHSSLIEHKHPSIHPSLPIPDPRWDIGARDGNTARVSPSVLGPESLRLAAAHLHLIDFGRIRSVCDDRRRRRSSDRRRHHREKSEIRRVGGRAV